MKPQTLKILAFIGGAAALVFAGAWLYERYKARKIEAQDAAGQGVGSNVEGIVNKAGDLLVKARKQLFDAGGGTDSLVEIV